MRKPAQQVTPAVIGWRVRKTGARKATRIFPTKEAAIAAATRFARNQETDLFIFGRDGRIREHRAYGLNGD